jgi:hypothetical protein
VVAQARLSPLHQRLVRLGMAPVYREKTQTGSHHPRRQRRPFYEVRYPNRVYPDFDSVPPLVAQTLTFIENRELLDPIHLFRNPAVEWDRLATAVSAVASVGCGRDGKGTADRRSPPSSRSRGTRPGDARRRAPRSCARWRPRACAPTAPGPITQAARRSTLVEYLNALPLAAQPGYGEVHGLGDGLWAWYGADFATVNEALRELGDRAPGRRLPRLLPRRSPTARCSASCSRSGDPPTTWSRTLRRSTD